MKKLIALLLILAAAGIAQAKDNRTKKKSMKEQTKKEDTAVFAGGCFWCMQPPFDKAKGVLKTVVGYSGGRKKNPTYEEVCAETTGHMESIQVTFDLSLTNYPELLEIFWRQVDPTDPAGQFCDKGESYRSAIFYNGEDQKKKALLSIENLEKSGRYGGKKIVTPVVQASEFWPAEEYHQKYYRKNPLRYKFYRYNCGRDKYLEKIWGKSDH